MTRFVLMGLLEQIIIFNAIWPNSKTPFNLLTLLKGELNIILHIDMKMH